MNKGVIINPVVKIMKCDNSSSEMADDIFFGWTVELIDCTINGWYKIRTNYKYEGYIIKEDFINENEYVDFWINNKKVMINNYSVDVLDRPKTQGCCITALTKGCLVIPTDEVENDFIKVILPDKKVGYIKKKFITECPKDFDYSNENEFRNKVVDTAKEYLGTQYRWGGKTPLGIDCSGLTFMAYYLNGVSIYRDAHIKEGFPIKEITLDNMKKGDLIFFPGHVGIYIGDYKFIHSSFSNDGVYINSLDKNNVELYRENWANNITGVGSIF